MSDLEPLRTIPDDLPVEPRPVDRRSPWRTWALPIVLFLATLATTLLAGGEFSGTDASLAAELRAGIPFAIPLLAILLAHEFGHYFTAKLHGVPASPPYFIPFPSIIGTLGAVIRIRGRIPSRRALIDIGASGPIAGFIVAVPLLILGLSLSHVAPSLVPTHSLPPQTPLWWLLRWIHGQPVFGDPSGVLQEGLCPLYFLLRRLVVGAIPPGQDVFLHPTAFAAWVGLLVTSLNLLPVGQLDGGHVLYALLGDRARTVGRVLLWVLVALGLVAWVGWLLWALIGWKLVGTAHPPVEEPEPLDRPRRAVAWISLALFLLTFMPVPLAMY